MNSRSINEFRRETARRLRKSSTDAEAKLWYRLRELPIAGSHIRRQVSIGPYVADFACLAARLVIEIDGSHHGEGEQLEHDLARTRWLESQGYRVIRFWNSDITDNMSGVLETIYAAIYGHADAESKQLKHQRRRRSPTNISVRTPPRRPPPAEPEG
jgi:very-short-patch-repair endonuclease